MRYWYEIKTDCFGNPVRVIVIFGLLHFFIHGIFVSAFVFSNTAYPPFYYADYFFGITGGVLIGVSLVGTLAAYLDKCQPFRCVWGIIVSLNVLTVSVACIYYAVERWNDVITTAITRAMRRPIDRDFEDYFWYALTVTSVLMTIPFIVYLVFITSFMFNPSRPTLFIYNYETTEGSNQYHTSYYTPPISVPKIQPSNAYRTQN